MALVVDERTDHLADKDQAADGWREWLRISNALNLREQPTVITALTDAEAAAGADHAKPRIVRDIEFDLVLDGEWQSAHDLTASVAEQAFVENLARLVQRDPEERVRGPVVGYEAADGIPVDFAWPDKKIAVCLDIDAGDRQVLELAKWRVFDGDDPDAVLEALRKAA
jgi:hypothetical protein